MLYYYFVFHNENNRKTIGDGNARRITTHTLPAYDEIYLVEFSKAVK